MNSQIEFAVPVESRKECHLSPALSPASGGEGEEWVAGAIQKFRPRIFAKGLYVERRHFLSNAPEASCIWGPLGIIFSRACSMGTWRGTPGGEPCGRAQRMALAMTRWIC